MIKKEDLFPLTVILAIIVLYFSIIFTARASPKINISNEVDIYRIGTTENIAVNWTSNSDLVFTVGINNLQIIGPKILDNNNFQKAPFVEISKRWIFTNATDVQVSSMIGTTLVNVDSRPIYNYNGILVTRNILEYLYISAGTYYANKDITYAVNKVGYMAGLAYALYPDITSR